MAGVTAESTELVGGSSVPQRTSSAESNFRELDDAFLQTQARIWLGEVLQIRFDEQMNISELLADGELLFELSEVLSRMLPTLSVDGTQLKIYEWKSLASNKSTRRYMPYYNVDSFLRMCKNLGMDGIDLFPPSDVVERRNTRKVCMCLRSLSKKAMLRDLIVPDFDSVTCTVAMPTDMVEGIRKSLEMSQSSSSLSIEQEAEKVSRIRYWRRMSDSAAAYSNGYSDNRDEAESSFMVTDICESSAYAYDAETPNISDSHIVRECNSVPDVKNEDDDQCEYLSPSNAESVGSPCSQYYSDEELRMLSADCLGSRISCNVTEMNSEIQHGYKYADVSYVPIDWGDSHVEVKNYEDDHAGDKIDYVSLGKENVDTSDVTSSHDLISNGNEHLETLDKPSIVDSKESSELGGGDPECVVTDFQAGTARRSSHEDSQSDNDAGRHEPFVCDVGSDISKPNSLGNTIDKDFSNEVLIQSFCVLKPLTPDISCNSENHVSKACSGIINAEGNSSCDTQNNGNATSEDVEGKSHVHEEQSPCSLDYDVLHCNCSSLLAAKSNRNDDHQIPVRFVAQSKDSKPLILDVDTIISADERSSQIKVDREAVGDKMIVSFPTELHVDNEYMNVNATNSLDMPCVDTSSSPYMVIAQEGSEGHDALIVGVNGKPINIDDATHVNSCTTAFRDPQSEAQSAKTVGDTCLIHHQCAQEEDKGDCGVVKQEGTDKEMSSHKPRRILLKSVVKGTALLGIAVFLLHLRKKRRENNSEAKRRPTHVMNQGLPKPSQKAQKSGSISSVYPAEKLRLGI